MIRRTRGFQPFQSRAAASSLATARSAALPCRIRITSPPCSVDTRRCPGAFAAFSRGITSQHGLSSRMVFTATHCYRSTCEIVGLFSAGSTFSTAWQVIDLDVQHQPDSALCFHGPAQHECEVLDLLALAGFSPCGFVGDDLRVGFENGVNDAQPIGFE